MKYKTHISLVTFIIASLLLLTSFCYVQSTQASITVYNTNFFVTEQHYVPGEQDHVDCIYFPQTTTLKDVSKQGGYWLFNSIGFYISNANMTLDSLFKTNVDQLVFTVYPQMEGETVTTFIHFPTLTKGKPVFVSGATVWSYDAAMAMINVNTTSTQTVTISWEHSNPDPSTGTSPSPSSSPTVSPVPSSSPGVIPPQPTLHPIIQPIIENITHNWVLYILITVGIVVLVLFVLSYKRRL